MSDGPKHVSHYLKQYLERLEREQKSKSDDTSKGMKR